MNVSKINMLAIATLNSSHQNMPEEGKDLPIIAPGRNSNDTMADQLTEEQIESWERY